MKLTERAYLAMHYERGEQLRVSASYLLNRLVAANSPGEIREIALGLNQVYLDGIIAGNEGSTSWHIQRLGLEALTEAGTLAIGAFYDGTLQEKIPQVKERILGARNIIANNSLGPVKNRHLIGEERAIIKWGNRLIVTESVHDTEVVVPVASDGFEPAFLASYVLGNIPVIPMRYSHCSKSDKEVRRPALAPKGWEREQVEGKKVMVIEGDSATGISLKTVTEYVLSMDPKSVVLTSVAPKNIGMLSHIYYFPSETLSESFLLAKHPPEQP